MGAGGERCNACPMPALIPEAWAGAMAYSAVQTQWRPDGALDYGACLPLLRRLLRRWRRDGAGLGEGLDELDLMEDVQVIEMAILEVRAERREQARANLPPAGR